MQRELFTTQFSPQNYACRCGTNHTADCGFFILFVFYGQPHRFPPRLCAVIPAGFMTSDTSITCLCKLRIPPLLAALGIAAILTLLRYTIANPADLGVLLNEEASIYLHAAEKSFLEFFMMPDSNYINFVNKFCAVVTLKVLKAFDSFALVQNLVNWFVAALFTTVFLSDKFKALIPSFHIRLALCAYLYLLPIFDMHMVFSQGYYVVFTLFFYLLALSGEEKIPSREIAFICLTAPFAVFSKPVFFVFGFAFLVVFLLDLRNCKRERRAPDIRTGLLLYLLALYAFQAWFTLSHHAYIAEYAHSLDRSEGLLALIFFLGKKAIIFMGYGLICPIAHMLPRAVATPFCLAAGIAVASVFAVAAVKLFRERDMQRLAALGLLLASSFLCLYGAVSVNFLYHRFFVQDIFAVQWSHRMIFPVILFALFSFVFWSQRQSCAGKNASLAFVCLLGLTGYCIPAWSSWHTGYAPSFTWEQTRPLLNERYPFIPHAHGIQFYYTRGLTFVSNEVPLTVTGRDTLSAASIPSGRKIHYFLLKQTPDANAITLSPFDTLNVTAGGVEYKAKLINPGVNAQYLFKFNEFIPSERFKELQIARREMSLVGKSFSGYIIGF
jgi:hypothetical protein